MFIHTDFNSFKDILQILKNEDRGNQIYRNWMSSDQNIVLMWNELGSKISQSSLLILGS